MKKIISLFALLAMTCGTVGAIDIPQVPVPEAVTELSAAQGPYFQIVPVIKFKDYSGSYFINAEAVVKWGQRAGSGEVYIEGLSPHPPVMPSIHTGPPLDLSKFLYDVDAQTTMKVHTFRVKLPDVVMQGVFTPEHADDLAKFVKGINKANKALTAWQQAATGATDGETYTDLTRMPKPTSTGMLSDYLMVSEPEIQGNSGYLCPRAMDIYKQTIIKLENELAQPKSGKITAGYHGLNEMNSGRPMQAANDAAYTQLANDPFGGATERGPAASMEQGAAGNLSVKPPKTGVKPPLPPGLGKSAAALNKFKKAAVEYGPDVAGGIILAGGAYLTQKQMTEHSRAGRPDKAVGLGTGYTAAVMSDPAVGNKLRRRRSLRALRLLVSEA
ncbi:MAG: hypothetical protein WC204_00040 [Elusimicrobiales bacterium]|jgi:hypothetical protein